MAAVSDEEFASVGCRSVAERFGGTVDAASSVHASLVEGGQELSSYPERCVLAHRAPRAAGRGRRGPCRTVELTGHSAWMDAAILAAAGVPTVVFGPGGEGAHTVEEWVDLDDVEACARTLAAVAAQWCR